MKNTRIEIRINKDLKGKWKRLAKDKNLSLTDFMISTIEKNHQFFDLSDVEKELDQMYIERKRQGTNLNQLVKYIKQVGVSKETEEDMRAVLVQFSKKYDDELKQLNKLFIKLYNRFKK